MRKICFRKNNKAQVLGLPMYLIIIMIIAIAVIAAVIFMMPKGTQKIKATVTKGWLITTPMDYADDIGGSSYTFEEEQEGKIKVTDMEGNPISNARVTLIGANVSWSGSTDGKGEVEFSITPSISQNDDSVNIKMFVKADGYDDFEDIDAIIVTRKTL